jgi:hypothetical protein
VLERQVDHALGVGGAGPQAVQVVEAAADALRAGGGESGGRSVGAGQPDDGVTGGQQLGDDGRADPAGCTGDEDAHGRTSRDRSEPGE